jgi:HNH endonuclease
MYGRYQEIDRSIALGLLDIVRSRDDSKIVSNLIAACGSDILRAVDDIQRLKFQENVSETSRKRLTDARLGQGKFRTQLDSAWGNACAVTRCSIQEVLRASHIKPWHSSNNRERLDPENGILLTAHLDAFFAAHQGDPATLPPHAESVDVCARYGGHRLDFMRGHHAMWKCVYRTRRQWVASGR